MPELPDLEYIQPRLKAALVGQTIRSVIINEPILIRNLTGETSESVLLNRTFQNIERVGPFLDFQLDGMRCVVHCMLAGRFELSPIESELQLKSQSKPNGNKYRAAVQFQCDSNVLSYSDSKKMGKIYLAPEDESRLAQIPGFRNQGIGILSDAFDLQTFISLLKKERRQVRVFLMDQTKLSAIGNAYADEILFDAGLHPKTMCTQLNDSDKEHLYHSIGAVIERGIRAVADAGRDISAKVRDHMLVRNRLHAPCPRCQTPIRRANVRGVDAFFCPTCQPETRKGFIDWNKKL